MSTETFWGPHTLKSDVNVLGIFEARDHQISQVTYSPRFTRSGAASPASAPSASRHQPCGAHQRLSSLAAPQSGPCSTSSSSTSTRGTRLLGNFPSPSKLQITGLVRSWPRSGREGVQRELFPHLPVCPMPRSQGADQGKSWATLMHSLPPACTGVLISYSTS